VRNGPSRSDHVPIAALVMHGNILVHRELGVTIPVLPADELPGHDKYSNLADKSEAEHDKDERANLHTRRFTRPDNAARTLVYRIAITAGCEFNYSVSLCQALRAQPLFTLSESMRATMEYELIINFASAVSNA